ncbi:MAG: hypothetical protein FJ144_08580 [Deltaproteobacteria bacterium]|nr:hypothetical protein [Deltaproteobacteria bacterium]
MKTRLELATAIVASGIVIASSLASAHAESGRRGGPSVVVSTVRDAARDTSIDAKKLADLDCQAERAEAQAKLAKSLATCLRRDAREEGSGTDLRACEEASFQKYLHATLELPCSGVSDVVGTYSCQGVLCSCHGDDCAEMIESEVCGESVVCERVGGEAVCSCLPPL